MANRLSTLAVALVFSPWLVGCALIMEEPPELVAVFYYDPNSASIPRAYSVRLPEHRMIRPVVIPSLYAIRGTDIYVREKETSGESSQRLRR